MTDATARPGPAFTVTAALRAEHANMMACVRCGQCLTSCPTYVLTGNEAEGPRGRIAMARALVEGQMTLTPDLVRHELNCLVCDACTAVCPAGVHMDPIQVALRAAIAPEALPRWSGRLARWAGYTVLAQRWLLHLLVWGLWLYQRLGIQWLARRSGLLRLLRLEAMESLTPSLPPPWTAMVPRGQRLPALAAHADPSPRQAVFFTGCVMAATMADVHRATLRVCQRAGYAVTIPAGQGCCGALHAHGGDRAGFVHLARQVIVAFEASGDVPIVVNSAGCGAMLKDYAHHLADDPAWRERAAAFSRRVRDFTELVAPGDLAFVAGHDRTITYQEPCHLAHAQRITRQPRALLRAVPGLDLREMAESTLCCGSAGVYNLTNPDEATQLLARKLDQIERTGASVVATANPGCLLHLKAGLARRGSPVTVRHLAELLDEATQP